MSLHPNITHAWIEWVIEDGEHKTELVIETNLETRPDASGFDEASFNSMVEAAVASFANSGHERVRVIPAR